MNIVITGRRPKYIENNYDMYTEPYLSTAKVIYKVFKKYLDKGVKITVYSGMAQGMDTLAVLSALKARKEYPDLVKIVSVLPCDKQHNKCNNKPFLSLFNNLLTLVDKITQLSDRPYYEGCMQERDEYLVDQLTDPEDFLLAIWDYKPIGGTFITVDYAKNQNKDIKIINYTKLGTTSNQTKLSV